MLQQRTGKSNWTVYAGYLVVSAVLFARQYSTFPMLDDFVYFFWFDSTDYRSLHYLLNPGSGYFWVRPVALLICFIQHSLFGTFMPGYRIAGIAWHSGNAFLVMLLAQKSLRMPPKTARIAGWLFLLHPAAVQSVCYPSGQSETIYLFFLLSALICFIDYYSQSGRLASLAWGVLFLTVSIFTKETAFILIPVTTGMILLGYKDKLSLKKIGFLAMILSFSGVLYVFFRQSLYSGMGGYGFDISTSHASGNVAAAFLWKNLVHLPAAHFFPLSPADLEFTGYVRLGTALLTLAVLIAGYHCKVSGRSYFSAILVLMLSNLMLSMVFLHHATELLAPRYLYLGSISTALVLSPVFAAFKKQYRPLLICVLILWVAGQTGFQRDFYRAGQVTKYVLTTLDHYCYHLENGGKIVLYDVPERVGSISINISHERDTVFNLETHRRCNLAPLMDMSKGQGYDNWYRYMNRLPGRVSVWHFSDIKSPLTGNTLVFSLDTPQAYR